MATQKVTSTKSVGFLRWFWERTKEWEALKREGISASKGWTADRRPPGRWQIQTFFSVTCPFAQFQVSKRFPVIGLLADSLAKWALLCNFTGFLSSGMIGPAVSTILLSEFSQ